MSNITINDLFGNPVDNKSPFILLTTKNINTIIKKLDQRSYDSVWEIDNEKLIPLLKIFRIDLDQYKTFGHMFFNDYEPKLRTIVLVNKEFSIITNPTDYKFIGNYGSGYIWVPIGPKGFVHLGLIYTSTQQKPVTDDYCVLDIKYSLKTSVIDKFPNTNSINFMAGNEFNLLQSTTTPVFTIYRAKLYNDIRNFKLIAFHDEKYITSTDPSNSNSLGMKSRDNNNYQYINYSPNGELKLGNKCISNSGNNQQVDLQNCDDTNIGQKWYLDNSRVISHQDNTCLTLDDNGENLKMAKCDRDNSNQVWAKEKPEVIEPDEGVWYPAKGKKVILVNSENPWYLNNEFKEEAKIMGNKEPLNQVTYQPYGNFKSKFIMDFTKPDLGYGHSYAERLGKPCPCNKANVFEGFGNVKSGDAINTIILILCLLIFLLLILKYRKN